MVVDLSLIHILEWIHIYSLLEQEPCIEFNADSGLYSKTDRDFSKGIMQLYEKEPDGQQVVMWGDERQKVLVYMFPIIDSVSYTHLILQVHPIFASHVSIPMGDGKTSIKSVPIAFLFNSGMFQMRKETLLAFLASLSLIYFNCAFGHSKITV